MFGEPAEEETFIGDVEIFELTRVSSYIFAFVFCFGYDVVSDPELGSTYESVLVLFFLHVESSLFA